MTKKMLFIILFLAGPAIGFGIYALAAEKSVDYTTKGLGLCMVWTAVWLATLFSPGVPRRKQTPE